MPTGPENDATVNAGVPSNDNDTTETDTVRDERVRVTPKAAVVIKTLEAVHGPLMFHQSGGCCDGSAPMCYPRGEFRVGKSDVLLGHIADAPFYMGRAQYERWKHTLLTIDVVPGRGSGFSLEAPEGVRFIVRSDVCMTE